MICGQISLSNGRFTVCISAFGQGHSLFRVCLWKGDYVLGDCQIVLTPGHNSCPYVLHRITKLLFQFYHKEPPSPETNSQIRGDKWGN